MRRQGLSTLANACVSRLAPTVLRLAALWCPATLFAAQPPQPPAPSEAPPVQAGSANPSGEAAGGSAPAVATPVVPPEIQIVRFSAPPGVTVEPLAPATESVPIGDGQGAATLGMKVGASYRLKLSNIPERPGAELYPLVEIVGHLHRPENIDPAKYPIRISWTLENLYETLDTGRLITQVVYLENPDLAVPYALPKDEIPRHVITPVEDPVKIAMGLGRIVAVVRLGGRVPSALELSQEHGESFVPMSGSACPYFAHGSKDRCRMSCGPLEACKPPAKLPLVAKDEYLCDGGDFHEPAVYTLNRTSTGVEPRDAVLGFIETKGARALPTNMVCIYAPRFAMVENSMGVNESVKIENLFSGETLARQDQIRDRVPPQRLKQNQSAELNRHRQRPSAAINRVKTTSTAQIRILQGYDSITQIRINLQKQKEELIRERQKAGGLEIKQRAIAIKTLESAVLTGIVESANDTVSSWKPTELAGVELPPKRPGMGVFKSVSATEAEPGDIVTFKIQYRNLGNTTISAVSVMDSLLPRLEYVPGSAQGPKGTVFSFKENSAGSSELRFDLPEPLAPGAEGYVQFQAKVR